MPNLLEIVVEWNVLLIMGLNVLAWVSAPALRVCADELWHLLA
jgi:hypothetical protein